MIETYIGDWGLHLASERTFDLDTPAETFQSKFEYLGVSGAEDEAMASLRGVSGLTISIDREGKFRQQLTGIPEIEWFDHEGVLNHPSKMFDGWCHRQRNRLYLNTDMKPDWSHQNTDADKQLVRFDSGDQTICDFADLQYDQLWRTVNVITDYTYVWRILLIFKRNENAG